jgi:hypothetical protein
VLLFGRFYTNTISSRPSFTHDNHIHDTTFTTRLTRTKTQRLTTNAFLSILIFCTGKEEMDFYSPAFSVNSDMTDEELDKYFETYVPLSRLPTPPPAKEHAIPAAPTSTTPPAPELTGTFSQLFPVAFLPRVFAMSYFPHQACVSVLRQVAHGPLHEGASLDPRHSDPLPTPLFWLHCSWRYPCHYIQL